MRHVVAIFVFVLLSIGLSAQQFYAQVREGLYVELVWQDGGGDHTLMRKLPGGEYVPLVTTADSHYSDTIGVSICGDTIHYQLWAGNMLRASSQVWFNDLVPPLPVAIQQVSTDSATGDIIVSWLPSLSNDVMAYIVCTGAPCLNPDTVYSVSYRVPSDGSVVLFRLFPIDSCGNPSALSEPCNNIVLTVDGDTCGGTYTAKWNAYNNMPGTMRKYVLQRYDKFQRAWVVEDSTSALQICKTLENGIVDSCLFRLMVCNREGASLCYSNQVWLNINNIGTQPCPSHHGGGIADGETPFYLPNAIIFQQPPNHEFLPCYQGKLPEGVSGYRLDIYNRVGCRVFRSSNPAEAFDGTYKGVPLGGSAYTYLLFYSQGDEQHVIKGILLLIK